MTTENEQPEPKRRGRPPGFKGQSNRNIQYRCSTCGREVGRDNLHLKRVNYGTMGKVTKVIRSRTVAWLCKPCMEAEPEWNQDPLMGSPGMRDLVDGSET